MFTQQNINIDTINISYLLGTITLEIHEKEEIIIDSEQKEKFTVHIEEKKVCIKGIAQKEPIQDSKNFFSGFFKHNQSETDTPMIETAPSIDMIIKVPKETIQILNVSGCLNISLKEISKSISIFSLGKNTIKITKTNHIYIKSSGEIEAKLVNPSDLRILSSGKTKLDIKSEEIEYVFLQVSGDNEINIKSSIHHLDAELIGEGKLFIKGNVDTKNISNSELCEIIVKDR